jgi:hypothetical protein
MTIIFNRMVFSTNRDQKELEALASAMASAILQSYPGRKT